MATNDIGSQGYLQHLSGRDLELLGERWYRLAASTAGATAGDSQAVTAAVAERFGHARRILNHVTDRYLFPFRNTWFPSAPA